MDGLLKSLVATASAVVIAGGAYFFWQEYQSHQRVELRTARMARDAKLASLTPEQCSAIAVATIPDKPGMEPRTNLHFADLRLCDELGQLGAYERHQLDLAGIF